MCMAFWHEKRAFFIKLLAFGYVGWFFFKIRRTSLPRYCFRHSELVCPGLKKETGDQRGPVARVDQVSIG
jgi:hypothetical protein